MAIMKATASQQHRQKLPRQLEEECFLGLAMLVMQCKHIAHPAFLKDQPWTSLKKLNGATH